MRSFSLLTLFHHGSPCLYITWGMKSRPQFKYEVSPRQHDHHHGKKSFFMSAFIYSKFSIVKYRNIGLVDGHIQIFTFITSFIDMFLNYATKWMCVFTLNIGSVANFGSFLPCRFSQL
jgi:hypothetical protein